jgi:hypothetical protein
VFCTVYRLRSLGDLIRPASPFYRAGFDGVLVYDRDRYNEMAAWLYDIETGEERMSIVRARIKIRDGGALISGTEMRFRASKSKGDAYRQTWWCVPLTKVMVKQPAGGTMDAGTNDQQERKAT